MTASPPVTAEWTVRAHLTLTRPDDSAKCRAASQSACNGSSASGPSCAADGGPVKVAYKWCSLGDNVRVNASDERASAQSGRANHVPSNCSFRSSGNVPPPSDSGISCAAASTENSQITFSPKGHIHSTCNIILSACMDFGAKPCTAADKCADFKVNAFLAFSFRGAVSLSRLNECVHLIAGSGQARRGQRQRRSDEGRVLADERPRDGPVALRQEVQRPPGHRVDSVLPQRVLSDGKTPLPPPAPL